jgi:hypothetical protein
MLISGQISWSDFGEFLLMLFAFGLVAIAGAAFMSVLEVYKLLEQMRQDIEGRDFDTLSTAERRLIHFCRDRNPKYGTTS